MKKKKWEKNYYLIWNCFSIYNIIIIIIYYLFVIIYYLLFIIIIFIIITCKSVKKPKEDGNFDKLLKDNNKDCNK